MEKKNKVGRPPIRRKAKRTHTINDLGEKVSIPQPVEELNTEEVIDLLAVAEVEPSALAKKSKGNTNKAIAQTRTIMIYKDLVAGKSSWELAEKYTKLWNVKNTVIYNYIAECYRQLEESNREEMGGIINLHKQRLLDLYQTSLEMVETSSGKLKLDAINQCAKLLEHIEKIYGVHKQDVNVYVQNNKQENNFNLDNLSLDELRLLLDLKKKGEE